MVSTGQFGDSAGVVLFAEFTGDGTYRSPELCAEHLFVLAILALQSVDVTLHPEHRVGHHSLP